MLNENELINAPAADGNYTPGRQGRGVNFIAFHHVVGSAQSALNRFSQPGVQVSAHFVVAPDKVYVCVNTDDTSYAMGNWEYNLQSVTIEHEGDWRGDVAGAEQILQNSARLVAWLRTLYPNAVPIRHRDVYPTACPANLPVENIWDRASDILYPRPPVVVPPPVTPAPSIVLTDIANQTLTANKKSDLIDLNNGSVVKSIDKGTQVLVSATAVVNGVTYYLTEYSFSKGINNGFKADDFKADPVPVEPPKDVEVIVTPVEPEKPVEPPQNAPEEVKVTLYDVLKVLVEKIIDWLKQWRR